MFSHSFSDRHQGRVGGKETKHMLSRVGAKDAETLVSEIVPPGIRLSKGEFDICEAMSENTFLRFFDETMRKNKCHRSFIGKGYYRSLLPSVIRRQVLGNPAWYSAYTPYQAEISQGRLEALMIFQTAICELTGFPVANASLLDESTACAEAMVMLYRACEDKSRNVFLVDRHTFPQTLDVLHSRAEPLGIEVRVQNWSKAAFSSPEVFGALCQFPNAEGHAIDHSPYVRFAKKRGIRTAVCADLLSLTLFAPPGDLGCDVAVGSTQTFGIPMGFGGPYAAYFATKKDYVRLVPGRIIGASKTKDGEKAYRMALQTREQHIRREKATSNICTSQVLLAVMSGFYAVYHGPEGLKTIATRIHSYACSLSEALSHLPLRLVHEKNIFNTLLIEMEDDVQVRSVREKAEAQHLNFDYPASAHIGISLDEATTLQDVKDILAVFSDALGIPCPVPENRPYYTEVPEYLRRKTPFLRQSVFHKYQTEHQLTRYMRSLEEKDFSLVHGMIPLGSCTMKLNASVELDPLNWKELDIHPFVPHDQAQGYLALMSDLSQHLRRLTDLDAISFQPNAGSQGEFAGLLVIKAYLKAKGEPHRNTLLIPSSAHGTNPASAVMAGLQVKTVPAKDNGDVDFEVLKKMVAEVKHNLAGMMLTYPSTHGIFEDNITDVCALIHENGGQVYMDGANLNAQIGLTSPGKIGVDICHLNLHKTFCVPHGGGGPGMGPIAAASHLSPYLPGHRVVRTGGRNAVRGISAAPFGSASLLSISYAYLRLMGTESLREATKQALLKANYLKSRLQDHYPILFLGKKDRCAHEFIVDCRGFKDVGVDVEDIGKRLMDYNFHAPTISFPVAGTLMIEPTESESLEELDRFCEAMIGIRQEIEALRSKGEAELKDNVLKNAPHTMSHLMSNAWSHPYSREEAAFPVPYLRQRKFWPSVSRVENAYGDRHLVCTCGDTEAHHALASE